MPVEPTDSRRWRLAALAIGCSGPVVGALAWFGAPWAIVGAAHALAAAAAWRLWRRSGPGGADLALVAATVTGCFPVVGSLGAWWVYGRPVKAQGGVVEAYRAYIGRNWEVAGDVAPLADKEQALGREVAVLPLGDQLGGADLAGKQRAAAALQRMEGAVGVKILRQALTHPADDTRLMASLALLKKEEALVAELKAARARAESHPGGPERLALATVARRYAESGLSAAGAAEALWRECAREARAASKLLDGAEARRASEHLMAAHLALDEPEHALEEADSAVGRWPEDVAVHVARLEALFSLGRTGELAAPAARLAELAEPGSDAHALAAFWGAHAG
jgi:hypothetical protein